MNVRLLLDQTLAAYLEEFGSDGYDRESFIDYVVAHLLDPGDAPQLIAWYRRHAAERETEMRAVLNRRRKPDPAHRGLYGPRR